MHRPVTPTVPVAICCRITVFLLALSPALVRVADGADAPKPPAPEAKALREGVSITMIAEHPAVVTPTGIDVDSQGHVAISLGVEGDKTLFHVLVEKQDLGECVVNARPNLDILCGNETLASTEIYLARLNEGRDRVLRRVLESEDRYDFILLDCGPSLSLLNMNALTFADYLLVPVSCDFLSLVGVKQLLKTLKNVNQVLMHPISILGILPTFYDMRNNISDESVKTLRGYFHDKVLPPIRVNTRLKEAPRHRKTIFEYAPESRGASDYEKLIRWVVDHQEQRLRASG